jgi:hypothetical protein
VNIFGRLPAFHAEPYSKNTLKWGLYKIIKEESGSTNYIYHTPRTEKEVANSICQEKIKVVRYNCA